MLTLLVGIIVGWLGLLVIIWEVRLQFQKRADHMRRTYELSFPKGMTHENVLAFIRSLSGLPAPKFLQPVHAIVFELYADETGIKNFLHIPGHVSSRVDNLLEEHLEGVGITLVKEDPVSTIPWHGVELSMRGIDNQLRVEHAQDVARSVRASFKTLTKGEAVVLQWIVFRDAPRPPDKGKLSDHTFHAALRIGAIASEPEKPKDEKDKPPTRAESELRLIRDVYAGLASAHAYGAQFVKRFALDVTEKIQRRAGTLFYPIYLNALELSALMGWPLDGSSKHRARPLAPDNMHDTQGIVLGVANHHNARGRLICMPVEAQGENRHVRVLGMSGMGKTNWLVGYALQKIAKSDMAMFLIEPHGDMSWDFLCRIPEHRVKDVIYFNPLDTEWPVGLNPFQGTDPELMSDHVVSIFAQLHKDTFSPQMRRVLGAAVRTTAYLGLTLYDTEQLLVNEPYRQEQLRRLKRAQFPELFQEWSWISDKHNMVVDSSVNRLKSFLASPTMRRMLSQPKGLDFDQIIREHLILIVPLPAARMGPLTAAATGQLVREMAWNAAMKQDPSNRQSSLVMMDEAHNFLDASTSKSDVFAESRKFRQEYVVAHQFTEQIEDRNIRHTMNNNIATQVVFRMDDDAKNVSDRLKPLTTEDIQNLPKYTVAARVMGSDGIAPTVTFTTLPMPPRTGFEQRIIAATRRNFARPAYEVDAEILTRHKTAEPKKRPVIGRLDDDETP